MKTEDHSPLPLAHYAAGGFIALLLMLIPLVILIL
jgi:hypothetical protein